MNRPPLERARDLAITDFRLVMLPDGVFQDRSGRTYLSYARNRRATNLAARIPDEAVPAPARRLVEWALYTLCGGAMATAIWVAFLVPCSCAVPSWTVAGSADPATRSRLDAFSFAARRGLNMNALARMR